MCAITCGSYNHTTSASLALEIRSCARYVTSGQWTKSKTHKPRFVAGAIGIAIRSVTGDELVIVQGSVCGSGRWFRHSGDGGLFPHFEHPAIRASGVLLDVINLNIGAFSQASYREKMPAPDAAGKSLTPLGCRQFDHEIQPCASPVGLAMVRLLLWQKPSGFWEEREGLSFRRVSCGVSARLSPGSSLEGEKAYFAAIVAMVDGVLGQRSARVSCLVPHVLETSVPLCSHPYMLLTCGSFSRCIRHGTFRIPCLSPFVFREINRESFAGYVQAIAIPPVMGISNKEPFEGRHDPSACGLCTSRLFLKNLRCHELKSTSQ